MARLEFEITGNSAGLSQAVSKSIGILQNFKQVADKVKLDFLGAKTVSDLNATGGILTTLRGQISELTNAALKNNEAFRDQQAQLALDKLSQKLAVVSGNTQLFGNSIQTQKSEIAAYEVAISKLLQVGLNPLDQRVTDLKTKLDGLNATLANQNALNSLGSKYTLTGNLIEDARNKVQNLKAALETSFDEKSIAKYNTRLTEAQAELKRLTNVGLGVNSTVGLISQAERKVNDLKIALKSAGTESGLAVYNKQLIAAERELDRLRVTGLSGVDANKRLSSSFNGVGLELGRVIQDAPFAANNFGAIGNNITRLVELLPGYSSNLKSVLESQGKVASSGNILKAGLASLFTGWGAITLAISAVVTAYTFYTQAQQKAQRETKNLTDKVQEQKQALDDYISTLSATSQASAAASSTYSDEIVKLDFLFSAIQKNSKARYENGTALEAIQRIYPEVFGSLKENEFLTDKVRIAYDNLRGSIIQTATIQAANKLASSSLENYIKNTIGLEGATGRANAELNKYRALQEKIADLESKKGTRESAGGAVDQQIAETTSLLNDQYKVVLQAVEAQKAYKNATTSTSKQVASFYKVAEAAQAKLNVMQPAKSGILLNLEKELKALQAVRPTIKIETELALNTKKIKEVQAKIDAYNGLKGTKKDPKGSTAGASIQRQISYAQQLEKILQEGINSAALSAEQGVEKTILAITQRYNKLIEGLKNVNEKAQADKNLTPAKKAEIATAASKDTSLLEKAKATEVANVRIAEAVRVRNEIQRINDESGVKAEQSRAKELEAIKLWYDQEIVKAQGNADIKKALDEGLLVRQQAVRDKYVEIAKVAQEKITALEKEALGVLGGIQEDKKAQVRAEWDFKIKEAIKYYDTLKTLVANDPTLSAFQKLQATVKLNTDQSNTTQGLGAARDKEVKGVGLTKTVSDFSKDLNRATSEFGRNFYNTLLTLNDQADQSFQGIFNTLVSGLTASMNEVFISIAKNALKENLAKGVKEGTSGMSAEMSKQIQLGAAAAGIAGGIISGVTKKTSVVGQGIGGALSGAGTGAMMGMALGPGGALLGAGIGAIVGGLSGIFGAKKAQKQRDAQLAEEKKQTELLRQQALAYTASIIGRMTENGVVNKVDVNEFGQLVASVSGKDIKFILDRNGKKRP